MYDVKRQILISLGRFALQSVTHRHVFVTPALRRFATTKSIGPFHGHRARVAGQWVDTDIARSGEEHRHRLYVDGRELVSGLPVEGPSTDFF